MNDDALHRKIEEEICSVRGIHVGDLDAHILDILGIYNLYDALRKRDPHDALGWSNINKLVRFYYHRHAVA